MITKNCHVTFSTDTGRSSHFVTFGDTFKNGFTDIRWIHSITRKKEKFDWRKWQLDYLFWKTSLLLIVTYWKFLSRVREANPNSTEKELKRLKDQTWEDRKRIEAIHSGVVYQWRHEYFMDASASSAGHVEKIGSSPIIWRHLWVTLKHSE